MKKLNVLALMPWYPATAARYFADAFEQLGHNVFRAGPMYFNQMGLQWPESELPKVDHEVVRESSVWNLNGAIDVATEKGFIPDFIFLSEENYQTRIVPTDEVPVVLWQADGWAENFARREMIRPTLAYCNHPRGVVPSRQERIPDGWKFMPSGAAPWIHKFTNVGKRDVDFCLYATLYGKRQQICGELKETGLNVSYGQRTTERYVWGYNRARFTYHNAQTQWETKFRLFETMAMGCVNIADENPLFHVLGFAPNVHYIPIEEFCPEFDNDKWPSAMAIKGAIDWWGANASVFEYMQNRAWHLVQERHTYQHRIKAILFDLGLSEDKDFTDFDHLFRLTYES